jgi:adenosylmethionine-8-amino-7-oxononanoate aminotransferase
VGDHILFSPPLNISEEEVEELVMGVKGGIEEVFAREEVLAEIRG